MTNDFFIFYLKSALVISAYRRVYNACTLCVLHTHRDAQQHTNMPNINLKIKGLQCSSVSSLEMHSVFALANSAM